MWFNDLPGSPPAPSIPCEKQKLNKSNLQPGRPFHIGQINRNSIFLETSPASITGGYWQPSVLAAVARSPRLPVTRNDGRPPKGAGCAIKRLTALGEGGLPLMGNHNLIGSCFNKLSLKWWREESCVNLQNHKPSSQCDAKIQTDTNLQPYCQLWFWHQHFELPTENRIWHSIPIMQSLSLKVLSVYLYLGEGETIYLCLLVIFFFPSRRWWGSGEEKGRKKKSDFK